jgi:hypothetical protein
MRISTSFIASFLAVAVCTTQANAWGATGHYLINRVAAEQLPASLPDFLHTPEAIEEIATLGPEADRMKSSGETFDEDNSEGHFLDVDDSGMIGGKVPLANLPDSRPEFDNALRAAGTSQYKTGYVPYEIIDGYERIVTDFAYYRVAAAGEKLSTTTADRGYFTLQRKIREALVLRDIGYWGHFVGDASQPLHISVHFNGWESTKNPDAYPNPHNYSNSHTIHSRFETALVSATATDAGVTSRVPAYAPSSDKLQPRVEAYLKTSLDAVPKVYQLENDGAIDGRTPAAVNLMLDRLAAAATMMRNLVADAWTESASRKVGYPGAPVSEIESAKTAPSPKVFGGD